MPFRGRARSPPFGALVVAAWAAPVLLQLASPVVPFIDVLPNHVAPAEHLRTFGTLTHLTDTQSPIYGPSRILLGYTALLGTITTVSGLPAGEALAGFILPSTLLVAVAVHRLATALGWRRRGPLGAPDVRDDDVAGPARGRAGDGRGPAARRLVARGRRRADGGRSGLDVRRAGGAPRLPDGVLVGLGSERRCSSTR